MLLRTRADKCDYIQDFPSNQKRLKSNLQSFIAETYHPPLVVSFTFESVVTYLTTHQFNLKQIAQNSASNDQSSPCLGLMRAKRRSVSRETCDDIDGANINQRCEQK